jgi:hypothetical protein
MNAGCSLSAALWWDAPIHRTPTGSLEVLAFHLRKNFGYNHGEASGMALTNGQTF